MNNDKSELLNKLRIDRSPTLAIEPRRPIPKWITYGGSLFVIVAGSAFGWTALIDKAQPIQIAEARVVTRSVGQTPAGSALLDATGYVVARRSATIGPKIAGKLIDVLVEEGMHVKAGQVIAHLDDSNAKVAYNQAKASLDQAETALANARPIYDRSLAQYNKGLISNDTYDATKATFDQSKTGVEVARASLDVARQNKDDTIISAPFAGVVTVKAAQAGEIISPLSAGAGFTRTGIATIVDMNSLEVEVDVNENFINRTRPDQPCTITLNAYPDWKIPGHVITVIPTADRTKATVKVRVAFNEKDERVLPEMGARVAFLADAKSDDKQSHVVAPTSVTVPTEAILASGDQNVVFVVRDNRVERRAVKLGDRSTQGQFVISGLSSGETVAVSGLDKLADGTKVKFEK